MNHYKYWNGRVGQLEGTFDKGIEVIDLIIQQEKLIDFKGLIKLGIQTDPWTIIELNGVRIKIGRSGIYELDCVLVNSLKFVNGATAMVDYVI